MRSSCKSFNRHATTIWIILGLLLLPSLALSVQLNSASLPSSRGGGLYDFEYNTSGVLDLTPDSGFEAGGFCVATIENTTGEWLLLRELSLPLDLDTRQVVDWICFLNTGGGIPDPGLAECDLTLESDSPCTPGGNICSLFIGSEGVNCDDITTAATNWSQLKQLC